MKKLILLFFTSLILGCTPIVTNVATDVFGNYMANSFEKEFTKEQFDSICHADTIPNDFSKWHKIVYKNFENNEDIPQYLYIKKLGLNQKIYRAEQRGEKYKITKRLTK